MEYYFSHLLCKIRVNMRWKLLGFVQCTVEKDFNLPKCVLNKPWLIENGPKGLICVFRYSECLKSLQSALIKFFCCCCFWRVWVSVVKIHRVKAVFFCFIWLDCYSEVHIRFNVSICALGYKLNPETLETMFLVLQSFLREGFSRSNQTSPRVQMF